jgi:hypothetical protein
MRYAFSKGRAIGTDPQMQGAKDPECLQDEHMTVNSMRFDVDKDGGPEAADQSRPDKARARGTKQVAASPAPRILSASRRPSSGLVGSAPRLLDRDAAAEYLSISVDTVDRLLQSGALHVVRLPVQRDRKSGLGVRGISRRILIDRHELDSLVDRCREVLL